MPQVDARIELKCGAVFKCGGSLTEGTSQLLPKRGEGQRIKNRANQMCFIHHCPALTVSRIIKIY